MGDNHERAEASTLLSLITGVQAPWLAALWPDLDILFRVDDVRRQVWFAVGAQMALRPEMIAHRRPPHELAAWLQTSDLREILLSVGLGVPDGWRRALRRLGPTAMRSPAAYLTVFDILAAGGPGPKVLHHAPVVNQTLVEVMGALEPVMREHFLILAFLDQQPSMPVRRAREWAWRLRRLRVVNPALAADVEASVRKGRAPIDMIDDMRVMTDVEFPEPPWPASQGWRYISRESDLKDVARRYRNCLATAVTTARLGRAFFYEHVGEPGMIMEIAPDEPYGHTVEGLRLAQNEAPLPVHAALAVAALADRDDIFVDADWLSAR